jgi:hypothetical protein
MFRVIEQELGVLINEKPVKQYIHEGRSFIEAKLGSLYSLKLKNNSYSRLLAVVSVDGINVISGEPATDDSPGYIIGGRSAIDINGFRTSDSEVHAFEFSEKSQSYASNSEQMNNSDVSCGVIGVKFFSEEYQYTTTISNNLNYWYSTPAYHYGTPYNTHVYSTSGQDIRIKSVDCGMTSVTDSANMVCSSQVNFDVGTKFSEKSIVDKVLEVFYASRKTLEAIGIQFDKTPMINFPSSFTSSKYCSFPKSK